MATYTGQITIGTTATQIVGAVTRQFLTVTNASTKDIYLGTAGVTISTGDLLPGIIGASETFPSPAAMFGVVASGTALLTYTEIE